MDEVEVNLNLTPRQEVFHTMAITILSALAGLAAGKATEAGYKRVLTTIRLKKSAA